MYAPACLIAFELLKGDLESVLASMRCINEGLEPMQRILVIAQLGRLLRHVTLKEPEAQAVCEQLIIITSTVSTGLIPANKSLTKHRTEKDNNLQARAMYLAAAVQIEIRKHQMKRKHLRLDSSMEKTGGGFNSLVRDAIYTALYAEATYDNFIASRLYVDRIGLSISKRCSPAKLLESIPTSEK